MAEPTKPTFNPDLLSRPWRERAEHFRGYILRHKRLKDSYEDLCSAISIPIPGRIVLVYGPSGVGKTTLIRGVQKAIVGEMMPELEKDPGRIPVVYVKAEAPDVGNFDWKKFYKSLLVALDDVLIDKKAKYRTPGVRRDTDGRLVFDDHATKSDLSDAVFSAVEHRRPVAIIADEAQDLGIIASGRKLIDQMNRIKHLADTFKVPFVLAGTYDLLKFRLLNGQLSRRCMEIHFGRYDAGAEEDVEEFKDVLHSFQKRMAFEEEPDLEGMWEYFYEHTLGCVGILKDWLTQAVYKSLEKGHKTLRDEFLEEFAPPMGSCQTMLDEILKKETEIREAETKEKIDSYRERLKLVPPSGGSEPADVAATEAPRAEKKSKGAPKDQAVPFKRKPKRDPVGDQKLAS